MTSMDNVALTDRNSFMVSYVVFLGKTSVG